MKLKPVIFFLAIFLTMAFTLVKPEDVIPIKKTSVETYIVFDSMNNKVFLAYENGKPAYYYSNIFTPVCNTGECLPVFINIYWNLAGHYLRYDQPEGKILTKLDHVPFTPEDYVLLDEILRDIDPRYDMAIQHSSPSQGSQSEKHNDVNQASPAPSMESKRMLTKYEMIDGVTGATAIQHVAKFIPGALYTTYTLWGLANDHAQKILNYTKKNLFVKENTNHFILHPELGVQYMVIENFYSNKTGENVRQNTLMTMIDTTDENVAAILLNFVYYDDYKLDTVINTVDRKFSNSKTALLQNRILYTWTYNTVADKSLVNVSANMHKYPDAFDAMIQLFNYKPYWPAGVLDNLLMQIGNHDGEKRNRILVLLDSKKATFGEDDWTKIKEAQKKYKE